MSRTKKSGKGMLNPHITQTIKEIFHQLERCLLAGFICIRYHKRIVRNEKISFFCSRYRQGLAG